ncbi:hypothetical protein SCG7109_BP_00040 [Chlamydiales bacterium SCGC AG-110-M15]|nr:hypothetical protein SCG7109_BP_00040 [Chlamydiales bacterium SCGC AG-110-M15]
MPAFLTDSNCEPGFPVTIWAIADLHLSFGIKNKEMDVFGAEWAQHFDQVEQHWRERITDDDLVLIAGDSSWAMHLRDALADLNWIHSLPGTKVIIKGNHDFWWSSGKKMRAAMPSSIHFIHNNAYTWNDVTIAGARLWDSPEYRFHDYIDFRENALTSKAPKKEDLNAEEEAERIFQRELNRLEISLKDMSPGCSQRIVMTHYPPIGADLADSRVSKILEGYKIQHCIFGHLHSLRQGVNMFGEKNGVKYWLTSCDYLNFIPIEIA